MANFETSIEKVLKHEGGYVNDPKDSGGETKYGIAKRFYPKEDIKNLTVERAKEIYKKDYWCKYRCDQINHDALAEKFFDTVVNTGPGGAVKFLQKAANSLGATLTVDGGIGPKTIEVVNNLDGNKILSAFRELQKQFYMDIVKRDPSQERFLKGWLARAAS